MATAVPLSNPIQMRTSYSEVKLDSGDVFDFTDAISALAFTPSSSTSAFVAINSSTYQSGSTATWVLDVTLAQDDAADSFLDWLNEHEGEQATILARFTKDGRYRKATFTVSAAAIGGTANGNVQTSSVSMPCQKPVVTEETQLA